jgi:hypothetical protein
VVEEGKLFHCFIDVIGGMWKRQVRLYELYPWKMLALLDPDITDAESLALLQEFKQLRACDMDEGVTKVWHALYSGLSDADLLMPGSDFKGALLLLALNKVTNVEIENNFARASSSRSYCRGRSHDASTMACKHFLAELIHVHKQSEHRLRELAKQCGLNRHQLNHSLAGPKHPT